MPLPTPNPPPDQHLKDMLYTVYREICAHPNLGTHRERLINTLVGHHRWTWRVVGISENAVRKIQKNAFAHPGGLTRAHFIQNRIDTLRAMFPPDGHPLSQKEWWTLLWQNDPTILMTKAEHTQKNNAQVRCYRLNWRDGYFADAEGIGHKHRKTVEGAHLRDKITKGEMLSPTDQTWTLSQMKAWAKTQ